MKKILLLCVICLCSLLLPTHHIHANYETAIQELKLWNKQSAEQNMYSYLLYSKAQDCRWYDFLADIYVKQEHISAYKDLFRLCKDLELWKKQDILKTIEKVTNDHINELDTYFLFLYKLLLFHDISDDEVFGFLESLLEKEDLPIRYTDDNQVLFGYETEVIFLILEYLNTNNTSKEKKIEYINKLWENNYKSIPRYWPYGRIFFLLVDDPDLESYKSVIIKNYSIEYYNFLVSFSKVRSHVNQSISLNNNQLRRNYSILSKHFNKDNNEIGDTKNNYDFHKEFFFLYLHILLSTDQYTEFFSKISELSTTFSFQEERYNKFSIVFTKLQNLKSIRKYKSQIIDIYWSDYYDFLSHYNKILTAINNNQELSLEQVNSYKDAVLPYYEAHKVELRDESITEEELFLKSIDIIDSYENTPNPTNTWILDTSELPSTLSVETSTTNPKDLEKKYYLFWFLFIVICLLWVIIFLYKRPQN